ncbi:IPExxxVDY family protein [Flavobacterium difficile]|uniref:IPExxxVDY family protein n=1 Tax=Flavobacterium difficile TaxID=2709659 RepID=A0ABX0I690_9FLAO|nr:IPExxxVDY family protein [Flavobacterium difficile]NHM02676.1 IPExxxVDY family protein [Flavobacterium difficile]
MANLKLTLDDFESNDFELFAIHTNLKDFKLSFLINLKLNVLLAKNENEITIKSKNGIGKFSRFSYDDFNQDITWELIKNQTHFNSNKQNVGFFEQDPITINLIPELKLADYLLKLDNTDMGFNAENIIENISTIPNISTIYRVETEHLKSINNLIF